MCDQAESLRSLVAASHPRPGEARQGALVIVFGAQSNVGATTLAVQLSLSWRRHGWEVSLVDANTQRPALRRLCPTPPTATLDDVLVGRKTLREARVTGLGGLPVIVARPHDPTTTARPWDASVIHQIDQLVARSLVVVDVGSPCELTQLLPSADHCLFVTRPEARAMVETYAVIKATQQVPHRARYWVALNHVDNAQAATALERRLQSTCDHCLNLNLETAGHVPLSVELAEHMGWFGSRRQRGAFNDAIDRLAARLESRWVAQQAATLREVAA